MGLGLLISKLDKFKAAANIESIISEIVSEKGFQQFLIQLNTKGQPTSQLFEFGVDSFGKLLDEDGYADSTIVGVKGRFKGKIEKGQRFDHITLEDTGDFYASFKIETGGSAFLFKITANPRKDNSNLFDDFGKDVVGWTEQNVQIIIDAIRSKIVPILKKRMAA
mgnify:CR=1 FL=1